MEMALALLLGLVIGSFLNVCIFRIPVGKSVARPRSHCPHCSKLVAWYDNVPVLSYLWLGGKCRSCRTAISMRYPAIEALTGAVALVCYWRFGFGPEWAIVFVFSAAMITLSFIDLDHRILPDVITLNGIWLGVLAAWYLGWYSPQLARLAVYAGYPSPSPSLLSVVSSLVGIVVGGGLLWLVGEAYFRFRGVEGMGFGDVKMMAAVGALLGGPLALLTIMIGSIAGSVVGILFIKLSGKDSQYELPFGTFLGFAAIVSALFGSSLIDWYLQLLAV